MNFYEKPLSELSKDEWEQICMQCGKCCMCKYAERGVIHFSNYMCRHYDIRNGKCSCYDKRFEVAKDECKKVSMELLENELELLPPSCAYRRLYEGKGLPAYHPLLTGNPKSVEAASKTVKSLPVFSETSQSDVVAKLLEKAYQQHWSKDYFLNEVSKIREKFELKWLETYPVFANTKKTAV